MCLKILKSICTLLLLAFAVFAIGLTVHQCREWQKPSENVQGWHYADWMGFVASPAPSTECYSAEQEIIAYSLLPSKLWLEFNSDAFGLQSIEPDSQDKAILRAAIAAAPDTGSVARQADSYSFARSHAAWDFSRRRGDAPRVPTFAYNRETNHLFVYFRPNEWDLSCLKPVVVPALLRTELAHEAFEYKLMAAAETAVVPLLPSILAAVAMAVMLMWGIRSPRLRMLWFFFWVYGFIPLVIYYTHCWLSCYQPAHLGLGFGIFIYPFMNAPVFFISFICYPFITRMWSKKWN